jgi:hypothetical protein
MKLQTEHGSDEKHAFVPFLHCHSLFARYSYQNEDVAILKEKDGVQNPRVPDEIEPSKEVLVGEGMAKGDEIS